MVSSAYHFSVYYNIVICLNVPAELIELGRGCHGFKAGITEHLTILPDNAHVQGNRGYGAEKEMARAVLV